MPELIRYQMLIDGQWVSASDNAHFDSPNPTTGAVWATVPEAATKDVDRAVHAADRAFIQGLGPQCRPQTADIVYAAWPRFLPTTQKILEQLKAPIPASC